VPPVSGLVSFLVHVTYISLTIFLSLLLFENITITFHLTKNPTVMKNTISKNLCLFGSWLHK